ncbi:hypothetical protein EAI_07761 [Harpegnathos saltator]|uniref:Uncharacterized protein n=1 Tax=Harpegnathos saltator TaxID=610380 RepID=E2BVM9_HARSA|nr:hypothetical protein EAI_07761 [Harpegnathos saltator]
MENQVERKVNNVPLNVNTPVEFDIADQGILCADYQEELREKLTSEIKLMHILADFIEWTDPVEREDYIESC